MKQFAAIVLSLLLFIPSLEAQNNKKINNIKRSSQYIYAEATMATPEEAYQLAHEQLILYVKEYAKDKKELSDNTLSIRNISGKCDSIMLQRGEMYKVFLYVRKADISDAANLTVLVADNADNAVSVENGWSPDLTKKDDKRKKNADRKQDNETAPIPQATLAQEGNPDLSLKLTKSWQQNVIDRLLDAASFSEARALLSQMLTKEFKIKQYGRPAECRDVEKAFWLIGDAQGKVVTVLGPGKESRTDFRKLVKSNLENYSDYDAVWFTLSK